MDRDILCEEGKNMMKDNQKNCKKMIESAIRNLDNSGNYFFEGVRPVLGQGQFSNLFWWSIKLRTEKLKEKYKNSFYDSLLLTPYIVNHKTVNELFDETYKIIKTTDKKSKYWGKNEASPLPHLDSETGNIHVEFDPIQWDSSIKQMILASKDLKPNYGPKLVNKSGFQLDELLVFTSKDENEKIYVPKECYYPRIDKAGDVEDENIEAMLRNVIEIVFNKES